MNETYLPGTIRERLQDLMKERKISQTELAAKIGCTDSTLSRFLTAKTDKLSDENIIRIARDFNVSTDFLLGVTNTPDRKNYEIAELGLSVQATRNLYTGKVNAKVVNRLLESPCRGNTTIRAIFQRYSGRRFCCPKSNVQHADKFAAQFFPRQSSQPNRQRYKSLKNARLSGRFNHHSKSIYGSS